MLYGRCSILYTSHENRRTEEANKSVGHRKFSFTSHSAHPGRHILAQGRVLFLLTLWGPHGNFLLEDWLSKTRGGHHCSACRQLLTHYSSWSLAPHRATALQQPC